MTDASTRRKIGNWEWLSGGILSALFILLVYRAVTQSLVHDEAFTYHLYIAGPFSAIFTVYDANHHFLSTVLVRASATLFGSSELALRLPSLIAAGWYFITVFRLAVLAFGEGYLLPLTVTLAAANPLVLDLLVAARGYSIALACLTYGIYCAVVYLSAGKRADAGLLVRASIALGLSITANLTSVIPAFVLTAVLLAILRSRRSAGWKHLLFPLCAIVLLFVLFTPVRHATAANFYYGAPALAASLNDLAALSLAHNEGLGGWNREADWKPWWRGFAILMAGAVTVCGIALSWSVWRRWHGSNADKADRMSTGDAGRPIDNRPQVDNLPHIAGDALLLVASLTIAGSWSVLFIAHHAIGLLYPLDRTGLYFLPLAGLTIPAASVALQRFPRATAISRVCTAFGGLIALQYTLQLNWTHFYIWQYDADTKAIVRFLAAQDHKGSVRVGTSWPLDPALNYYRETRGLTWLQPLTREGPDGVYDTYILCEPEQDRIARYQLHVVYRGAISGTVVAQK